MENQSPGPTTVSGRPRRRALEACTFCRKRKIKCNNEQPICANCKIYGKECIYEPLTASSGGSGGGAGSDRDATTPSRRPAPRRKRTKSAAEHKARSRSGSQSQPQSRPALNGHSRNKDANQDRDEESNDTSPSHHDSAASAANHDEDSRPNLNAPRPTQRTNVSRIVVSPNGVSSYHGRTSALFEENLQERAPIADSRPRMPEEWIEKGLVAEAARQRQLEEYNYHSGLLDFDGVDPELGMHLLNLHWNRQHHSFNITYRPAFMRDMACKGPYFSKLLLNAIYFGASKFSPRTVVRKDSNDVRTAGWEFRERVRKLLGSALDRSDVTTIQALLVMTNSLFALGDERSAAWLYAGLAFRMIIDLGMHVDAPDLGNTRKFSDEDLEIRRRVFWGAFVVDKIQSLYQGRPVTLKESDTLVPIKFLDTYEEFEHWKPFAYNSTQAIDQTGSPAYSISTFTSLCRLSVAMSDILSCIYAERSFDQNPADLSALLESLDSKLRSWREKLPEHLIFDPSKSTTIPPPHVFSLHAMYNVLTILLHRPFVADGHLYNTTRSISVSSFITCASAADRIVSLLRSYHQAFSVRRAPYLISYACYVAATIHVRIAAKRSTDSEAYSSLETCLAVFRENQETNWAVKRAHTIVQGLMKRLGVNASSGENGLQPSNGQAATAPTPNGLGDASGASLNEIPAIVSDAAKASSHQPMPDEVSPNMGWSDIDGIIQSFARGQDASYAAAPEDMNGFNSHQMDNFMQPMPATTRPVHPNVEPMRAPSDFRNAMDDGTGPSWSTALHDGGTASIDDLLFGFNSSALDSYPF